MGILRQRVLHFYTATRFTSKPAPTQFNQCCPGACDAALMPARRRRAAGPNCRRFSGDYIVYLNSEGIQHLLFVYLFRRYVVFPVHEKYGAYFHLIIYPHKSLVSG